MQIPVKISEPKTTTVFSGTSVWGDLNSFIRKMNGKSAKTFILVDENTEKFCLPVFLSNVPVLNNPFILRIKPGESSKTTDTAITLWNELLSRSADRDSLLINLGGGVISDLGGFVASTFKRGITYINVPTTLMSMADASVGGKTAINIGSVKNMVGSFYLPAATYISTGFLKTLDNSDLISGLAEVFKIALVADRSFWEYLNSPLLGQLVDNQFDELLYEEIILRSVAVKCKIVQKDFLEENERAILNFGHTIGHGFEALSFQDNHLPMSHGFAVSMGIICESYLSVHYCGLEEKEFSQISRVLLSVFGYYPVTNEDIQEILKFMDQDKKKRANDLSFTLLSSPGKAQIRQTIDKSAIFDSLNFYRQINSKY